MLWVGTALVSSVLFFMPGLLEQFEAPKIEAVRVCGLSALAWSLVSGRAGRPRHWVPLDRAVAGWLAAEVLATLLSVSPRLSLLGETRQREGLLTSLALTGLYFAARDAFARPGRARMIVDLALTLAALAGLYAATQAAGWDPLGWRREAVYTGGFVRPFATLGHPNLMGVLTAAAAPMALARAMTAGGPRSRWLYGGAALLLAAATILTLSRAAWLGLGAGLMASTALALGRPGRDRTPGRPSGWALLVCVGAVALVAVGIAASGLWGVFAKRVLETFAGGGASGSSRLEIWRTALEAWRARPLIGQGPDLFETVFTRFQTPAYWRFEWTGLPTHAHSIYLHTLATRGIVGLIAAGAWVVALAGAALRAWCARVLGTAAPGAPAGLVAAGIGALVSIAIAGAFGALGITGALLITLISAMLAGPDVSVPTRGGAPERGRPSRASARAVPRRRRWPGLALAAVVGSIAFLWCFTELRASRAAAAARELMIADPPRAVSASAYAVTLAPHDDRLWRMHAQTLLWLTTGLQSPGPQLAEAEAAARRAVALAPQRAENRIILARVLATREARGDTAARAEAEAAFQMSLTLAPQDGLSLIEYADHEAMMGRAAPALAAARRAVALYPAQGEVLAALARAWLAAGEPGRAAGALQRALGAAWHDLGERRAAERLLEELRAPAPVRQ
jgi:O-antigen ligase